MNMIGISRLDLGLDDEQTITLEEWRRCQARQAEVEVEAAQAARAQPVRKYLRVIEPTRIRLVKIPIPMKPDPEVVCLHGHTGQRYRKANGHLACRECDRIWQHNNRYRRRKQFIRLVRVGSQREEQP